MKERERVRFRFIERAGMIIWYGRVVVTCRSVRCTVVRV